VGIGWTRRSGVPRCLLTAAGANGSRDVAFQIGLIGNGLIAQFVFANELDSL
jgi:hypothetical protein